MSKIRVKYRLADGALLGAIQVSNDADLALNYDSGSEGLIEVPEGHDSLHQQMRWRIWRIDAGLLVQKVTVTITPDRSTFPADGIAESRLTLGGLVGPGTLQLGNGLSVPVSPGDSVVILTSDVRRRFVAELVDDLHWSEPVAVEAV